ncbi:hypothetical protein TNCV_2356891 [Trichonephila clavipes]|nr:hypothetical protein TNCV_2356891 [Trichonephila clavipes]
MLKQVYSSDILSGTQAYHIKDMGESATWKSPQSLLKQKFHQKRSKWKVILGNIQGSVHLEFIPEGRTANEELYASIRKKNPKLWTEQSSLLHISDPQPPVRGSKVTAA